MASHIYLESTSGNTLTVCPPAGSGRCAIFRVIPAEVKKELADIAGNLLEFIDVPEAEQYRESLALRQQGTKID